MCIRDRFTGALRLFDALTHTLTCSSIGCRLFDSLHRPACSAQAEVETALFSFKGQTSKSSAGVRLLADSLVEKLPLSRRFRGLSAAKTPALGCHPKRTFRDRWPPHLRRLGNRPDPGNDAGIYHLSGRCAIG